MMANSSCSYNYRNQHDRPQGFRAAQLARRGQYPCHYECGRVFRNQTEAKAHANSGLCPKKAEAFEDLDRMAEIRGFVDNRESNSKLLADETARKEEEHKQFVKYLNSLPDMNRLELTERSSKKFNVPSSN